MTKIDVGWVGAGFVGQAAHLDRFSRNKSVNIKGIAELRENLRKDVMKSYNIKLGWTPDIIIYLKSDTSTAANRCFKRSRVGEETIPIDYLDNISNRYNKLYNKNTSNKNGYPVFTINANNEKSDVLKEVCEIISKLF